MNRFGISGVLAALLFIVPVAAFIMPDVGNLESERRKIAAFPGVPTTLKTRDVKNFFRGIDAFFTDRFPLRAPLLNLSVALYEAGGDSLNMDKSYRGKENWLFLGNSYDRSVDKLQGKVVLSRHSLERQAEKYKKIQDKAEKNGAEFLMFIGPNKSSIYPEQLPSIVIPAQQRFISPLLDSLSQIGVRAYDPTERLIGAKTAGLLYYRTDTHWNALGANEAFEGFREWAGLPALPPHSFTEGPPNRGDLVDIGGYQNFPLSAGDNFVLHWSVFPVLSEEGGLMINPHAVSEKTVWVFGDSFAEALKPYITTMFRETHFFKHKEFEQAVSSHFPRPDMMLWVVVERNFANVD